jgi:hypothetical protein
MRDVYLPDPQMVAWTLHANDLLQGRVLDLSSDADKRLFAVVKVVGIERLLVVPVDNLTTVMD